MRWYWWVLIGLMVIGWWLRVAWVWDGAVSFHYDMSRDAFLAQEIWRDHQLKVIGPPTSIPGLYHGVGYYYLIAPLYAIGQGDPRIVALLLSLLSVTAAVPIFLLARQLFKNPGWGLVAAGLFLVSFEATQYGPWISNPNPAVVSVAWFFYWLYQWVRRRPQALVWVVIAATISIHFQFFLIYLWLIILITGIAAKLKPSIKDFLLAGLAGLLIVSPFIISIVKFQTLSQFLTGFSQAGGSEQAGGIIPTVVDRVVKYANSLARMMTNNFSPQWPLVGIGLLVAVWLANLKRRFISLMLWSSAPVFILAGHSNIYANIGLILPVMIGMTGLLRWIWQKSRLVMVVGVILMVVINLMAIRQFGPGGQQILVIQQGMKLNTQLDIVDRTYQLANGQPFSINTITVPFWTNTTWAYLYQWYGQQKYGYVPSYYGQDQLGMIGGEVMKHRIIPEKKAFLIIEPKNGMTQQGIDQDLDTEFYKTYLVKHYDFDTLVLEERTPINEK